MTDETKGTAREGFWLIGREARASNADPSPIGALWGGVFSDPFMGLIEGRTTDDIYSVYCEYEGDHTAPYTIFLGYRVPADAAVPTGLVKRFVPAGEFMTFVADGPPPASIVAAWQQVYAAQLDRTYEADYEIHPAQPGEPIPIHVGVR